MIKVEYGFKLLAAEKKQDCDLKIQKFVLPPDDKVFFKKKLVGSFVGSHKTLKSYFNLDWYIYPNQTNRVP